MMVLCFVFGFLVVVVAAVVIAALITGIGLGVKRVCCGYWDIDDLGMAFVAGWAVVGVTFLVSIFSLVACEAVVKPYLMK